MYCTNEGWMELVSGRRWQSSVCADRSGLRSARRYSMIQVSQGAMFIHKIAFISWQIIPRCCDRSMPRIPIDSQSDCLSCVLRFWNKSKQVATFSQPCVPRCPSRERSELWCDVCALKEDDLEYRELQPYRTLDLQGERCRSG